MNPLFVNMSDIFENYVRSVLESGLQKPLSVKNGNNIRPVIPLFENGFRNLPDSIRNICSKDQISTAKNSVAPDILIKRDNIFVLAPDVKYKPIKGGYVAKRGDIEQSITYATRLGLDKALTIHPCTKAEQKGLHYSGQIGAVHVFCYCIDLSSSDMPSEERDMTLAITSLLRK